MGDQYKQKLMCTHLCPTLAAVVERENVPLHHVQYTCTVYAYTAGILVSTPSLLSFYYSTHDISYTLLHESSIQKHVHVYVVECLGSADPARLCLYYCTMPFECQQKLTSIISPVPCNSDHCIPDALCIMEQCSTCTYMLYLLALSELYKECKWLALFEGLLVTE